MRKLALAPLITAVALVALTGCAGNASASGSATIDTSSYQAAAEKAMKAPTAWPGPVDGPKAATGVKAMFIACGFAAEGCKGPADAAAEAGAAIGWDVTVVDGQFDPQIFSRSISQAIDGGYKVIILNAISSDAVAAQVAAARKAGIIVGSLDGANTPSDTGVTFEVDEPVAAQGENMANYMIWKSGGNAHANLLVAPEFNVVATWMGAAQKVFESCSTCTVSKVDQFTSSEADTRLPTLISSTLRQDPKVNVVLGGYDAAMLSTIPTLAADGRTDLLVGGFNGISPMIQFIRDGKATATSAVPLKWGTWAAFDNANRLLQGQAIVAQNLPTRLITVDNIADITTTGQWDGGQDYKSHFTAIWK